MATTAAAATTNVYRLRRGIPGGWPDRQLIRVVGASKEALADFLANHYGLPEQVAGPVDPREHVAELDLSPPMDFTPPPIVKLRNADVRKKLSWSDQQLQCAIDHLGFPKGTTESSSNQYTGRELDRWREWIEADIDRWLTYVKAVFPSALPAKR
jgi:hypothetical protein